MGSEESVLNVVVGRKSGRSGENSVSDAESKEDA